MQVVIKAVSAQAREAIYAVKGVLFVEGNQPDVNYFDFRTRQ